MDFQPAPNVTGRRYKNFVLAYMAVTSYTYVSANSKY